VNEQIVRFRKTVYEHYEKAGRHTLPWRLDTSAWGVLVSEFMLQQTQIERVVPYWQRWMENWPSPAALSAAPLAEALREWSGLGYNRRGRFLWEAARRITACHGGVVPGTPAQLETLPGVGPYTAGAIACFAYNHPAVFIETNIRAALLHFFFSGEDKVKDSSLTAILEAALDRKNPRRWYWALMDWGAAVKKLTVNPNRRSAHYTRQSRFEGSFRQRRGAVIRSLATEGPASAESLQHRTGIADEVFYEVVDALEKDLMVACNEGVYMISSP
jgi:A/G-specific adenine glycosylase